MRDVNDLSPMPAMPSGVGGVDASNGSQGHLVLDRRFVGKEVSQGAVGLYVKQLSQLRLEPDITVLRPCRNSCNNPAAASLPLRQGARPCAPDFRS